MAENTSLITINKFWQDNKETFLNKEYSETSIEAFLDEIVTKILAELARKVKDLENQKDKIKFAPIVVTMNSCFDSRDIRDLFLRYGPYSCELVTKGLNRALDGKFIPYVSTETTIFKFNIPN